MFFLSTFRKEMKDKEVERRIEGRGVKEDKVGILTATLIIQRLSFPSF